MARWSPTPPASAAPLRRPWRRRDRRHERRRGTLAPERCAAGDQRRPARPALRAALSALGIAIGTAAIVAVLGLSSSSQAGLLAEIDRIGTNMRTLQAGPRV